MIENYQVGNVVAHWVTKSCEWVNGVLKLVFEQQRETVNVKIGVRKQPETEVEVVEETA